MSYRTEVVAVGATACRASAVRERFGPRADVKCDAIVPAAWKENKKSALTVFISRLISL